MADERSSHSGDWVEILGPDRIEARLREAAGDLGSSGSVDDLELGHLARVILECSLLLSDVYSDSRLQRIMHPERDRLAGLVDHLIARERMGEGEVLYRIRRLPDDVRVVGDKALFDLGLRGVSRVKGYDLVELGPRAYRIAGEVLELLAEDRRLREFFKQNRLLMLPLEQEVVFLRQCSERFPLYAEILRRIQRKPEASPGEMEDLRRRVPLMAAAAEALAGEREERAPDDGRYVRAGLSDSGAGGTLSDDEMLSAFERTLLFSTLDLERLREALRAIVVDQDQAVDALCDEFSLFAAGTRDLRKPPAYFLVGPTGVGKNHLVETLCRLLAGLWGQEVPLLTIEGPNYTYPSDINELRGATRGFIRSDEEGILSVFHERAAHSPLSVILVDEVEKAHPNLRRFFLSILDRGTTTDNRGRILNFANSMVFFTSNLGYSDAQEQSAPIGYRDDSARREHRDREIRRDLRRALTPEFLNRVRLIHFRRLGRSSAERILDLEVDRISRRYEEVHGVRVRLDPAARDELLRRGFSPRHGARRLASTLESVCNVGIARRVRRDDRRRREDRRHLAAWIREIREGKRAYEPDEIRRKVRAAAGADLDYDVIRVVYRDGHFDYETLRERS